MLLGLRRRVLLLDQPQQSRRHLSHSKKHTVAIPRTRVQRLGGDAAPPDAAGTTYDTRYTESMTTTIKVSNDVRDRLKGQAALAHRTLGQHLEYLASLGEREARMASLRAAVQATSPEDLASYVEETRAWDRIENA